MNTFTYLNIKNKILNNLSKKKNDKYSRCFNFLHKIRKKSEFKSNINKNHAYIYFQSLGKNTFVTVLYNNKLIYNKSMGELKIGNNQIKRKEKRMTRNIYLFGERFTNHFFNKLVLKYKIKRMSIYFNTLSRHYQPLLKKFRYKWYGLILKARKKERKFLKFKKKKYLKKRKYLYPRLKRKVSMKLVIFKKLRQHFINNVIIFKSISDVRKFPYNGCKNRRMKI